MRRRKGRKSKPPPCGRKVGQYRCVDSLRSRGCRHQRGQRVFFVPRRLVENRSVCVSFWNSLDTKPRDRDREQWKMVKKNKWEKERVRRMVWWSQVKMLATTESERKNENCGKLEKEKETTIPTRTFPLFYRRRDFSRVRLFGLSTKLTRAFTFY